jgi:hypothetical protein
MVRLAREITIVIVDEYGPQEMLRRLSHPNWFQAFGCVLGLTGTAAASPPLCAAL